MEFITICVSAQTLHSIGAGLQELPFKIANPAIQEIDKQVQQFMASKPENIVSGNEEKSE